MVDPWRGIHADAIRLTWTACEVCPRRTPPGPEHHDNVKWCMHIWVTAQVVNTLLSATSPIPPTLSVSGQQTGLTFGRFNGSGAGGVKVSASVKRSIQSRPDGDLHMMMTHRVYPTRGWSPQLWMSSYDGARRLRGCRHERASFVWIGY